MSDDMKINTPGLDKIMKALSGKMPKARVGILGDKNVRGESAGSTQKKQAGASNAEVGAAHEFGTATLPQRSFLRVPISEHLAKKLEETGLTDKETLKEVIKSGTLVPWLKKVAIAAEGIVLEAFDSGGFGKWKPSDMTHKKNHQTLVETQQLRNSITSEVKE